MAQNDLDAIRYSRLGVNGTSRFTAMGGAFGALGADLSCAGYNPGGLALFTKGEVSFGGGLKFVKNDGTINGKTSGVSDASFVFNNFGFMLAWPSQVDKDSRHVVGFTNMQVQNFYDRTRTSSYTTNSIVKDMLNLAQKKKDIDELGSYENMGYQVFVIDSNLIQGQIKFITFVDLKRNVLQTRDIVTSGRTNDINFSYAYSYKDKYYIGASLGLPRVKFTSTTTHSESDDKDSMKVVLTSAPGATPTTYSNTYHDPPPHGFYPDKLGFNSLTYVEYFNTSGKGVNLKLGGVARINDNFRLGMYFHSPTVFTLEDTYYNTMSATFDYDKKNVLEYKDPADGGYFKYKIITPSRLGLNTGFIIGKLAAIGLDYELVNYKNAQLSSTTVSDFAGVNAVIKNKYSYASNIRAGIEFNVKPVLLRAGYNMQGSPFGNAFSGSFVRNTFSLGFGFRSKNHLFFDFAWYKTFSSEDYYMFNTIPQKSVLAYRNSQLAATIGIKF